MHQTARTSGKIIHANSSAKKEPEHLAAWQSYTELWNNIFSGRDWFCPTSSRGLFYKGHEVGALRCTFFAATRPDILPKPCHRQLAGAGNNGGAAYGVAILTLLKQRAVCLISCGAALDPLHPVSIFAKELGLDPQADLPDLKQISPGDIIVDGMLGIGLNRPPEGAVKTAINWVNQAHKNGAHVIAIDVPSGLDASSGRAPEAAITADITVMCLTRKQGCYTGSGPDYCGALCFNNLGCEAPETHLDPTSYLTEKSALPTLRRAPSGHKGTHGNVLVLGGWSGMEGAGALAGLAALKTGAGKVFVCGPDFAQRPPELIGVEKSLDPFCQTARDMDAIVAGPGLGAEADAFLSVVWELDIPLVLDADGLHWLALTRPKPRGAPLIATPHPGEARALLGTLQENRFAVLQELQELQDRYGGQWVPKGAGTLIGPDPIYVNPFANSALGTAGSGEVLAGILGALLAQGCAAPERTAVWLHSKAASLLIEEGHARITAGDLIGQLGRAVDALS